MLGITIFQIIKIDNIWLILVVRQAACHSSVAFTASMTSFMTEGPILLIFHHKWPNIGDFTASTLQQALFTQTSSFETKMWKNTDFFSLSFTVFKGKVWLKFFFLCSLEQFPSKWLVDQWDSPPPKLSGRQPRTVKKNKN